MIRMERLATQTLLGVRFWDDLTRQPVADGLHVTAQLLNPAGTGRVGKKIAARRTQGGVFAFFGLLRAAEQPLADDPSQWLWHTTPAARQAVIEVEDVLRRYLPMTFTVSLPHRGVFRGRADWVPRGSLRPILPNDDKQGVFLWSSATRTLPGTFAAIRAQLVVGAGDSAPPAAHAFACVFLDEGSAIHAAGISDETGALLIALPYPPIPQPPDSAPYPPLAEQTFRLRLRIYYKPTEQVALPGSNVPSLPSIFAQAQARIGTVRRLAPLELGTQLALNLDLRYGQPMILRTRIDDPDGWESVLRILPN
jgi:hypothetical protein